MSERAEVEEIKKELIEKADKFFNDTIFIALATQDAAEDDLATIWAFYRMGFLKKRVEDIDKLIAQGWNTNEINVSLNYINVCCKVAEIYIALVAPNNAKATIKYNIYNKYTEDMNKEEYTKFIEFKKEFENKAQPIRELIKKLRDLEKELEECEEN